MSKIKERDSKELTKVKEIKKKWQEELYKKALKDWDNHNGVFTLLEPNILEYEVK